MSSAMPVTIIGGYLGSGKTTLINHLLRNANGIRLAVMVNDFGNLAIDAELIEAQDGDVISLSGGCICCSYGDDLSAALLKLQTSGVPPEHIFIEASGVALPGAIGKTLSLLRAYRLDGIVVLADASTVMKSAKEKYIGDTIDRQLSDADLIILNKLDLLAPTQADIVKAWMSESYSHARFVGAFHSQVLPEVLFAMNKQLDGASVNSMDSDRVSDSDRSLAEADSINVRHVSVFASFCLEMEQCVDASLMASKLADKHCGLVRAKGFVRDNHHGMRTIQVVGRRWSVSDAPAEARPGLVCIGLTETLSEEFVREFCMPTTEVEW